MTKLRPVLSPHAALVTIAQEIGWSRTAAIAGRAERTVRRWSEHDVGAQLPLEAACRLDHAYLDAGGDIAPFESWYRLQRRMNAARARDLGGTSDRLAIAAKETGEAISAQIHAARAGACAMTRRIAKRETEEAILALSHTLPELISIEGVAP